MFGSVFAQQMTEAGRSCLVVDRRDHVGGNCHTYEHEDTGITVHSYGTHIFHTSDRKVWDYVNRFTEFNRYRHRVLTRVGPEVYSMPINLGTFNRFFRNDCSPKEMEEYLDIWKQEYGGARVPENLEEKAISLIGEPLYKTFIRGYTKKQWGRDPRELPASIITRLPLRTSYDDGYFDDLYEGIPVDGYTPMFRRMLEGVDVELGMDFFLARELLEKAARLKVVYTGPVDRYFDFGLGRLGWRSVRFEKTWHEGLSDFQGTSVMNFADESVPWTRIHEPKHLHPERAWDMRGTLTVKEFPHVDDSEPYYPINFDPDRELYARYAVLAEKEKHVIFGGRLANYRYYDMHQVVAQALKAAEKELRG